MKCMSSYCVTVCVSWRRKSTCRLFLGLQGFLWMEACCALTVGWMNGRERRTNEWERWRDVCGEIGRGGGYVILRFRSASRELVCLWLILSGWGGRGLGMARERESEREKGRGRRRQRWRGWGKESRKGGVWSFFVLPLAFFFSTAPSPISDVIQVTYSSLGGSLPRLSSSIPALIFSLSLSLLPHSLLSWLTECMNEQVSLSHSPFNEVGGGVTQEAVRQTRAGEEERKSDKEEREEREFPWRLIHIDCWSHPLRAKPSLLSV